MTPERAIQVVAQRVAWAQLHDAGDQWESHPEIGEHDWDAVARVAEQLIPPVEDAEYDEAIAVLATRAEHE